MGRQKQFHHKTVTGCKTCKARRIKCDESKPSCYQCTRSNRACSGYEIPRKAWIFTPSVCSETKSRSSHRSGSESDAAGSETQSQSAEPVSSRALGDRALRKAPAVADYQNRCHPLQSMSGPYRRQEEQFFFKFFVEVAMSTYISRSQVGEPFWRFFFPQVAWHLEGARYALLAMAMVSRERIQDVFVDVPEVKLQQGILEYESRAMRSVIKDASSMEGVLITSMAFWVIAILYGEYARTLQHAYFCQRIIQASTDLQNSDSPNVQYCNHLSRAGLQYFRTTRGPCPMHDLTGFDVISCSATCFIPEDYPLHVRVADILHHLREADLGISACRHLLNCLNSDDDTEVSTHLPLIISLLENSQRKIKFLIHRWSNHAHLQIPSPTFERDAHNYISMPYTASPFRPVLTRIHVAIKSRPVSVATLFSEAEHLMHDGNIMPNLCASASRGHPKMMRDFGFLVFLGSKAQADMELQDDFRDLLKEEEGWTAEEETWLWREFMGSARRARGLEGG